MATKPLSTITKLANLEHSKKQRIAKIEEEINTQISELLLKRKEEIFKIFSDHSSLTIDDKLLIGFLKFINLEVNKDHPILNELIYLATKSKLAAKTSNSTKIE